MAIEDYTLTVGLEVHAELKTGQRCSANSKNDPDEKRPNVNICPVCMGFPGTLPTINKSAVAHVIRTGIAIGGSIADFTEFDRKNYFYPDIPKGYQITQLKYPLVSGGLLAGVPVTRIHLEEDTARSSHAGGDFSLVDYNRAGIPLMELVTEPVIRSAEQASQFAKELQLLLQTLGAGDANMEKGEMRVEANISVSKNAEFGTKVEVKNLNSFRAVEHAIAFEMKRHIDLIEAGGQVIQETRGWDETKEVTFSQRAKENSHDYRYFPEPDLPKIWISKSSDLNIAAFSHTMPELPWNMRIRYVSELGLKKEDTEFFVRLANWKQYFEHVVGHSKDQKLIQTIANYLTSDLAGLLKAGGKDFGEVDLFSLISTEDFLVLMNMVTSGLLSSRGAKDILKFLFDGEKNTESIATEKGLLQKSDEGELTKIAEEILQANPAVVSEYKQGKVSVIQFFVGQGMKATKGSANPEVLKSLFEKLLG